MGVPAFYRWLSSRYPKCIALCDEEEPVVVDGVEIPIDCTQPSPNGHVDNLYLDMNGIIHPCFHPEDKPAPLTFDECFKNIFAYIDRIMAIVRPRKVLYMAIDGVAPRAKMNQQRSRRFKTAKEAKDKMAEEKRIRAELKAEGLKVRQEEMVSETTELSDSNIITPGTAFMAKLSVALQYYIHQRINTAPAWKSIAVTLSDANVPGEGEHKIMEFIREQRGRPGWNPNVTHVVSGLDADLIHLALATHEPRFHILREVVFGQAAGDAPEGGAKPKIPYQYLKISILREYLALEFNDVRLPFPFDKERVYDDFVFLCFFVGNDFLPHSPTLEIREGGIDLLMTIYKRQLPRLGGWLCDGAKVDLKRVEMIIREVSRCEERILQKRMRIIKNQESKRKSAVKRPLRVTVPSASPPPFQSHRRKDEATYNKGTPKKQKTEGEETPGGSSSAVGTIDEGMVVDSEQVWSDLMSVSPDKKAEHMLPIESMEDFAREKELEEEAEKMVKTRVKDSTHEKADMFDSMVEHGESVGFGVPGWKDRYYRMKFPEVNDKERKHLVAHMTEKFVEGLMWVMAYYYEGVASWTWYYPYHYAPFASDMVEISRLRPKFDLGEPFLPVNQLMAVLPAASRFCLPQVGDSLEAIESKDSPILDFYPEDFKCDMNGKRFSWQAVVLLPFIDEERLIKTTKKHFSEFTDEEKDRNKTKLTQFYVGEKHPLTQFIHDHMAGNGQALKLELDPEKSDEINGSLCIAGNYCPETLTAPFGVGEDIKNNKVCMASFLNPPHQRQKCRLLSGAVDEVTGLTPYDIPPEQEMWHEHPRAGNNPVSGYSTPRPQFAIDRDAAHRFVVHSVSNPRFRDQAPERNKPVQSTLRASAPEFVPAQVTRMALQMTGQLGAPNAVRPPLIPPPSVTDAAIRLSERVQRPRGGSGWQMAPTLVQQDVLLQQQHARLLSQFPNSLQQLFPGNGLDGGGFQQQFRPPMFPTFNTSPSNPRPPQHSPESNFQQQQQRQDHARGHRHFRREGGETKDGHRKRKH